MSNVNSPMQAERKVSIARRERQKSLMLRGWIVAGLFFMALPGTLLGFSNLLAISAHHGSAFLPAAWMQGHGHAQVFGWIGSFVLGIGFYSQPSRGKHVLAIPGLTLALWISGVALRWVASVYGWQWQLLYVVSSSFELLAISLFLAAASQHKRAGQTSGNASGIELWMMSVLLGTAGFAGAILFNFVECLRLSLDGTSRAFPYALDQRFLILLAWGFIVPTVWGFSARWLPSFLAIPKPKARVFACALLLDIVGILLGAVGWFKFAAALLAFGSFASCLALNVFEKPKGSAKVQGIHPSFPFFVRLVYLWLAIAGSMSFWAAFNDAHGGIWGASRHALTVGFAATMVFAIGPRILSHFGGVYSIFSKKLIFASFLLLQGGCTLRVVSEPLAYEGYLKLAWKTLPYSGMLELGAVLVFAVNLTLTFALGRPALAPTNVRNAA